MGDRSADWALWADVAKAELWEAVALSLDIEPRHLPGYESRPISGGPWDDCPPEYRRRLRIACAAAANGFELASVVMGRPERCGVVLSSLRAWAATLNSPWTFPTEFPAPAAARGDGAAPAQVHSTRGSRRDALSPVIDALVRDAENPADQAALWNAALTLAGQEAPPSPLLGVGDGELKWRGDDGSPQFLSRKAFMQRLGRMPAKAR